MDVVYVVLAEIQSVVLHRQEKWLNYLAILPTPITIVLHRDLLMVRFIEDMAEFATYIELIFVILRVEQLVKRYCF